jgi:hypothetical protein
MNDGHHAGGILIADRRKNDLVVIASWSETENGGGGLPN